MMPSTAASAQKPAAVALRSAERWRRKPAGRSLAAPGKALLYEAVQAVQRHVDDKSEGG